MSIVLIREALLDALEAISPAITTIRGNASGEPVTGTPYQRATVLFAKPGNAEIGSMHLEQGFLQTTLCYPLGAGEDPAQARAELIRTTFYRGSSWGGSLKINITFTPEILPGFADTAIARWCVPVRVPFSAYVA